MPKVEVLVLDAGPLLSLTPLRGLSRRYITSPLVISELKDKRAKEYFERLSLTAGVNVEVLNPDALSLAKVTLFAKKTGDYSVLSPADLHVIALTYALEEEVKDRMKTASLNASNNSRPESPLADVTSSPSLSIEGSQQNEHHGVQDETTARAEEGVYGTGEDAEDDDVEGDAEHRESLVQQLQQDAAESFAEPEDESTLSRSEMPLQPSKPLFDDPSSEDDGEGEWITPANVAIHKSRALSLLPVESSESRKNETVVPIEVACMTADFAMQNVLLQMGLSLVGVEGKRISSVKSWVLRCHACFKICKDSSKKFCPSCGNPTLLRTTVTTTAASPDTSATPTTQIHLKKNFQYRNRGSIYSIPSPKPGRAKGGTSNIILREDQVEFQRGVKREEIRVRKEDKKMANAIAAAEKGGLRSWADPDWIPDMLLGQSGNAGMGLPAVGYGRRNPNEVRKSKK